MAFSGSATTRTRISWTGSEEDFIAFSDEKALEYRGMGLDSPDLGDSLGWWDEFMRDPCRDFEVEFSDSRGEFKAVFEMELFEWEGIKK